MSSLEKFRVLGISEQTLAALAEKGFEEPSPIQAITIPMLLKGECDVIGQAQTGTGKTAAFGIPIIEKITSTGDVKAIILAPTRELVIQIAEEMNSLKGKRQLVIAPIYGGQSIELQLRRLHDGVDIVVGTPGRVMDMLERRALNISKVEFAVLDEADEMLNMGFIEDIESILQKTPENKRMLMFSATMPRPILTIAEKHMRQYEVVNVKNQQMTTDLTDQIYFEVRMEDKMEALCRIIDMENEMFAMVFCRTKNDVDQLFEKLGLRGYAVECLHGDIAQAQRTRVIEKFKAKKFNILLATDVAARGIDVTHLTHVINYSIPQGTEAYIHRIGRTGRAGKTGTAITFVTPSEFRKLTFIKREVKGDIRKEKLPDPVDIVVRKKERVVTHFEKLLEGQKHAPYVTFAQSLIEKFSPEIALAALLRIAYKQDLIPEHYAEIGIRKSRESQIDGRGQARLFIAVGKEQNYGARAILDLIWDKARIPKTRIGKIDCFDKFSFINCTFEDAETLIGAFSGYGRGTTPFIEIAKSQSTGEKPEELERFEHNPGLKKGKKDRMPNFGSTGFGTMRENDFKARNKGKRTPPPSWDSMVNSPQLKKRKKKEQR